MNSGKKRRPNITLPRRVSAVKKTVFRRKILPMCYPNSEKYERSTKQYLKKFKSVFLFFGRRGDYFC